MCSHRIWSPHLCSGTLGGSIPVRCLNDTDLIFILFSFREWRFCLIEIGQRLCSCNL